MLTCRQTTQLLSEKQDRKLGLKEKWQVQFHISYCQHCRRFGQQMKTLSLISKEYTKKD